MAHLRLGLIVLLLFFPQSLQADGAFEAFWSHGAVHLHWRNNSNVVLQRSTAPWSPFLWSLSRSSRLPIKETVLQGRDSFDDSTVASGVEYTYVLRSGQSPRAVLRVTVPGHPLPPARHPQIRIDKANYALEVWEGQHLLKRYPVAMGATPWIRKLQFDQSSTPEGRYKIIGTQPQATYYKALDIDYPNAVDRARYQILKPNTEIGGEIEIHGKGVERNWTWGCVAMRNTDIDEIFAHPEIGVGTEVWIYGGELSLADLKSDLDSPSSPLELGARQRAHGLKVTCLWDRATRARLGRPR